MEFVGYVLSILMGLSLGLIGGGGSILTVPILVYFFKQEALMATTASLFVVGSTALVGAVIKAKNSQVDLKTGALFALPSFAGVFVVRQLILPMIPLEIPIWNEISISKSMVVLLSFAILMISASRAMISSGRAVKPQVDESLPKHKHGVLSVGIKGFLVGCVTAFVGAGGGFLIIPALVLLLRLPMRLAVGTSLAIIAANSLFGFAISVNREAMDITLLGSMTLLGIAGLFIGHRFSAKVHDAKLKQGFGYFVLLIGLLMLADQVAKMYR